MSDQTLKSCLVCKAKGKVSQVSSYQSFYDEGENLNITTHYKCSNGDEWEETLVKVDPTQKNRKCYYNLPWHGPCKRPADIYGICDDHKKEKCSICGNQAEYDCPISGSLICSAPLCNNCQCRGH